MSENSVHEKDAPKNYNDEAKIVIDEIERGCFKNQMELFERMFELLDEADEVIRTLIGCGNERPDRKVICQLKRGHKGSHRAVVYWEDEL